MCVSTRFSSVTVRLSFSAARAPAAEARHSWYRVAPEGAGMSRLSSTSNGASEPMALGWKLGPEVDESTLR